MAAVGELNTKGEHLMDAVMFLGLQALQQDSRVVAALVAALDVQRYTSAILGERLLFPFGECARGGR